MRTTVVRCAVVVLALAGVLQAVPVTGTLNISGAVSLTSQVVDFLPAGTGTGTWSADPAAQSGSFTGIVSGGGTIKDMTAGTVVVGSGFSLPAFITFAANPAVVLDLNLVDTGVFTSAALLLPAAPGQTATPAAVAGNINKMYNMMNLPGPSAIYSFTLSGDARNITTGEVTPMTGNFTLQFAGKSMQDVWATMQAGGSGATSWSASFTVTPEPVTVVLLLAASSAYAAASPVTVGNTHL